MAIATVRLPLLLFSSSTSLSFCSSPLARRGVFSSGIRYKFCGVRLTLGPKSPFGAPDSASWVAVGTSTPCCKLLYSWRRLWGRDESRRRST